MKNLLLISKWLLVIGGLAWGIEGIWEINIFDVLLGQVHLIETLVDLLIGLSALMVGYDLLQKA